MYSSFQSRPALPRLFPPGHSGTARPAISSVHARPRPREPLHPPRYTSEDQPIDDLLQARHWAGHRSKYPHRTGLARQGDGLLLMWYVSPRPGPSRGPLPPPSPSAGLAAGSPPARVRGQHHVGRHSGSRPGRRVQSRRDHRHPLGGERAVHARRRPPMLLPRRHSPELRHRRHGDSTRPGKPTHTPPSASSPLLLFF